MSEEKNGQTLRQLLRREFYGKLGLQMRPINADNEEDDLHLTESMTYFLSRVEGVPITSASDRFDFETGEPQKICVQDMEEIRKDRYLLPEGVDAKQKMYFGLYDIDSRYAAEDEKLLAVIDIVEGYPDPEYFFIGKFFLDAEVHHIGLAQSLMDVIYSSGRQAGYRYIKLAAYEVNEIGRRFWLRQGFCDDGFVMRETGAGNLKLYKMIKAL